MLSHDFGWHPDLADHRDYSFQHEAVVALLRKLKTRAGKPRAAPEQIDWREYCGPIDDQEHMATSPAHACVAMIQYFERRASGRLPRLSRLFADCTARRLMAGSDSPGVSLRAVLKAAVRCGIPPEKYWPYESARLKCEPDPFAYSFQQDFRTLSYVRLDSRGSTPDEILDQVRSWLAAGFSIAFGFAVCSSIGDAAEIPFPVAADSVLGGQAVTAVGYDDKLRIRSDKGALLVRNSWGTGWGDEGYGWLPYAYIKARLAIDFWTLLKPSWLKSGEFELPANRR